VLHIEVYIGPLRFKAEVADRASMSIGWDELFSMCMIVFCALEVRKCPNISSFPDLMQ